MTLVAPTDRPKSVNNRCVFKRFWSAFVKFHLCIFCSLVVLVIRHRQISSFVFVRSNLFSLLTQCTTKRSPIELTRDHVLWCRTCIDIYDVNLMVLDIINHIRLTQYIGRTSSYRKVLGLNQTMGNDFHFKIPACFASLAARLIQYKWNQPRHKANRESTKRYSRWKVE